MTLLEQLEAGRIKVEPAAWSPREREAWAPPSDLPVSEWADQNRVLPADSFAAEPGPWRTDRTPYLREIMDAARDPSIEEVVLMKSTQVGGTECLHNVVLWKVAEEPAPIVLVMPREKDAASVVAVRLKPSVMASPRIARHVTGWAADWGADELRFDRCSLYVRSAQSPADLASLPAGLLVGDECDKWPGYRGKESSPWHLARERLRTYQGRAYLSSTPTWDDGLIYRSFLRGDQRLFFVPCPHCGEFAAWEWDDVHWNEDLAATPDALVATPEAAWIECAHCKGKVCDRHKDEALQRGLWVPRGGRVELRDGVAVVVDERRPRSSRSYRIWAAYSPWISFGQLVRKYLELHQGGADEDDDAQHWTNSWLGLPWRDVVEAPEREGVAAHVRGYERDEVPEGARCVIMSVDVQKMTQPYVVRAWGARGESWLIRCGVARSWELLSEQIDRIWGEQKIRMRLVVIDCRHRTDEVIDFARAHRDVVRMLRGVQRTTGAPFTSTRIEKHPTNGKPLPRSLRVWHPDVDYFRDRLARAIESDVEEGPKGWHLHADVPDTYLAQLSSHEKVRPRHHRTRKAKLVWRLKSGVKVHDWWDCEVYQQFGAMLIGADRIKEAPAAAAAQTAKAAPPRPRRESEAPAARSPELNDGRRAAADGRSRKPGRPTGGFLGDL